MWHIAISLFASKTVAVFCYLCKFKVQRPVNSHSALLYIAYFLENEGQTWTNKQIKLCQSQVKGNNVILLLTLERKKTQQITHNSRTHKPQIFMLTLLWSWRKWKLISNELAGHLHPNKLSPAKYMHDDNANCLPKWKIS